MEETQTGSDSSFAAPVTQKDWPAESPVGPGQWPNIKRKYRLSRREIHVCKVICRGCNNKQIAEKLDITLATVDSHINKINLKVGVHSRIRLLLRFLET